MQTAAWRPRVLVVDSVIATRGAPIRRIAGRSRTTSSVSPLCERARTTSPRRIRPRSPWTASAGWSGEAEVPVEENVAASFWPTSPALPIPVTITEPRPWKIIRAARAIAPSSRSPTRTMAPASTLRTFLANARASASASRGGGIAITGTTSLLDRRNPSRPGPGGSGPNHSPSPSPRQRGLIARSDPIEPTSREGRPPRIGRLRWEGDLRKPGCSSEVGSLRGMGDGRRFQCVSRPAQREIG